MPVSPKPLSPLLAAKALQPEQPKLRMPKGRKNGKAEEEIIEQGWQELTEQAGAGRATMSEESWVVAQAAIPAADTAAVAGSAAAPTGVAETLASSAGTSAAALSASAVVTTAAVGVGVAAAVRSSSGSSSSPAIVPAPADTTSPSLAIASSKPGTVKVGDALMYTFTFSEAVSGFTAADVTVLNGSKGSFTKVSETTYTLVVTPDAGLTGNLRVQVAAGVAQDAAGNGNQAAADFVQAVDLGLPSVDIASSTIGTVNAADSSLIYTFTFSEAVSGFTAADVTVLNGSKGSFTKVSDTTYTLVVTPDAGLTGNLTVQVAAGVAQDAAGNGNQAAADFVQAVDLGLPSVLISSSQPGTVKVADGSVTYTFTFSEVVSGFTAADVTVLNGSKGSFTKVSDTVYMLVVTPQAGLEGNLTVQLAAGAAVDAVGNPSQAAADFVQAVDLVAPVIQGMSAAADSALVELNYSSTLDAINPPSRDQFSVSVNGQLRSVLDAEVSGSKVILTLASALARGDSISVSYLDPSAGDDSDAIQDLAGNDAGSFSSGLVADGYVRGARVYIDTNNNGVVDEGTDFYVGLTNEVGNFFIPGQAPRGPIIAVGGVNIDTGVPNTVPLKAPAGSSTINPLTTLVQAVVELQKAADPDLVIDAAVLSGAASAVAQSLGLTSSLGGASLLNYDPIAANNVTAQKAAAQVATVVSLAASGDTQVASAVVRNLATTLQEASSSNATVSLSDPEVLSAALTNVAASAAVQSVMVEAAAAIENAATIGDISKAQSQFLDTQAPEAARIIVARVTRDDTPEIRVEFNTTDTEGLAVIPGDRLVLKENGVDLTASLELTVDDVQRGYKIISDLRLSEGPHLITASLTDAAGNRSDSVASPVTIDTRAPNAPLINLVAGDDVINAAEMASVLSGAAEGLATVRITLAGNTRTVTANDAGQWTYTPTADDLSALKQGSNTISVVAVDAAGNESVATSRSIFIDTLAPQATASITGAADNVEPGVSNVASGATTNDNTLGLSGTVTGILGADEKVVIYNGSNRLGEAVVSNGTWSFTTASLTNATHSFTARVEDAAGNRGNPSAAYTVTVDATIPQATVTITGAADDVDQIQGNVPTEGLTNDGTPLLSGSITGSLPDGYRVVIYNRGVRLPGEAVVDGSSWTYAPATLAPGRHSFTAVVENSGGNQGVPSAAYVLNVDTTAPDVPFMAPVAGDHVINASEQEVRLTGQAEPGATVLIGLGGLTRSVSASSTGVWSYTLQPADMVAMGQGEEVIEVRVQDAAGNLSAALSRAITVDTEVPLAPTFKPVALDNILNASEAASEISGQAQANARVLLTLGAGNVKVLTADTTGLWRYVLQPADIRAMGQGAETISATVTDAAGNTSEAATLELTIDTVAPALTTFTLADSSNTGDKTDNRSSSLRPVFQVTAEKDVALSLDLGDGRGFQNAGTGTGTLQNVFAPLGYTGDGSYTVVLRAVDQAGNVTIRTGSYVLDTTAPLAPLLNTVAGDNSVNAQETGALISGKAEPGATVRLSLGEGLVMTLLADASGNWSYALQASDIEALDQKETLISATATDSAGNTSQAATLALVVDVRAPAEPRFAAVAGDNTINASELAGAVIRGTAEALATIRLTLAAGQTRDIQANAQGQWSYTLLDTDLQVLAQGDNTLSATATDAAGNTSAPQTHVIHIDTGLPSLSALALSSGSDTGLPGDNLSSSQRPSFAFTAEAGAALSLDLGDGQGFRSVGTGTGALQTLLAPVAYSQDGVYSVVLKATDAAGNVSTQALSYVLDKTVPLPAVLHKVAGDDVINAAEITTILTGSAEALAMVRLTLGAGNVREVMADAQGQWSYTLQADDLAVMGEGPETISVSVVDAAGNLSEAVTRPIVIDTRAPTAPVIVQVIDDAGSVQGWVPVNGSTDDGILQLHGRAEPGALVQIMDGGTVLGTVRAENNAAWSFTTAGLLPGSHSFTVIATDAAGNTSAASAAYTVTVNVPSNAEPVVSTATRIDWIQDQSGTYLIPGDFIEVLVRFTSLVKPTGNPQLGLSIVADNGQTRLVKADYVPYLNTNGQPVEFTYSMRFEYEIPEGVSGRYHIGPLVLSGGAAIMDAADPTQAADLSINLANAAFTASNFIYPGVVEQGTPGHDLIGPWVTSPDTVLTDGVLASIDGGAGNRDVLAIPIVLPASVTTPDEASRHYLFFDGENHILVFKAGIQEPISMFTLPEDMPPGVETFVFHPMYKNAQGVWSWVDDRDLHLSVSVLIYSDPVTGTDRFIQGSAVADILDISAVARTDTRYVIRGGYGDDVITGHDGIDIVFGDAGNDLINLGKGNDRVFVTHMSGTDTVIGGDGVDTIVMNLQGNQATLNASLSGVQIQGITGDWVNGTFTPRSSMAPYTLVITEAGVVEIRHGQSNALLMTATEMERLQLRPSHSDMRAEVPLIFGNGDNNTLVAAGGGHPSVVIGLDGDDRLTASQQGNDVLLGGAGNDQLLGMNARDLLFGGSGNDILNGGLGDDWLSGDEGNDILIGGGGYDTAAFRVALEGSEGLSFAPDANGTAYLVKQGSKVLARITATATGWQVEDLGDPTATGFGIDQVQDVDVLRFGKGLLALDILTSQLVFTPSVTNPPDTEPPVTEPPVFPPPAPKPTVIDWIQDLTPSNPIAGDDLVVLVHFTNAVEVLGTPVLWITIVDALGPYEVEAVYEPYRHSDNTLVTVAQSMRFVYTIEEGVVGQYHIGQIDLNGGAIKEASFVGTADANLAITPSNSTITAGAYIYPDVLDEGTDENDLISPWEGSPDLAPTDGDFSMIDGGDGDRDLLGVPIVLPGVLTEVEARAYRLSYDGGSTIRVFAPGSNVPVKLVTVPAEMPVGIESMIFFAMFKLASGEWGYAGIPEVEVQRTVLTYIDPVNESDYYIRGSTAGETIDAREIDPRPEARFLIRAGAGDDLIIGHDGPDAVIGEGGSDTILLGKGNDRVFVTNHPGTDTVDGGEGIDTIVINIIGQNAAVEPLLAGVLIRSQVGYWGPGGFVETASMDAYRLDVNESGAVEVRNASGTSLLMTATGMEQVQLRMSGSDQREDVALVYGDATANILSASGQGVPSVLIGLDGNDRLMASNQGGDVLMGGAGHDELIGGHSFDMLFGGSGDDILMGNKGDDWLVGGAGADILDGGDGDDIAGFALTSALTTALTGSFDSVLNAYFIMQGATALARVTATAKGWQVEDLGNTTASGFGVDQVEGVETLLFATTSKTFTVETTALQQFFLV